MRFPATIVATVGNESVLPDVEFPLRWPLIACARRVTCAGSVQRTSPQIRTAMNTIIAGIQGISIGIAAVQLRFSDLAILIACLKLISRPIPIIIVVTSSGFTVFLSNLGTCFRVVEDSKYLPELFHQVS
jgi:hypothetical protein